MAGELLERTLNYITQTKESFLEYDPETMLNYALPPTRKKSNASQDIYDATDYNQQDPIPHHDDTSTQQTYVHHGPHFIATCYTDIDLADQHDKLISTLP